MSRPMTIAAGAAGGKSAGYQKNSSASLYTVDIFVDQVKVDGVKGVSVVRFIFADGASVNRGNPQDRHGLSTLSQRSLSTLALPVPGRGVILADQGMKPPRSADNPLKDQSWVFVLSAYPAQVSGV